MAAPSYMYKVQSRTVFQVKVAQAVESISVIKVLDIIFA